MWQPRVVALCTTSELHTCEFFVFVKNSIQIMSLTNFWMTFVVVKAAHFCSHIFFPNSRLNTTITIFQRYVFLSSRIKWSAPVSASGRARNARLPLPVELTCSGEIIVFVDKSSSSNDHIVYCFVVLLFCFVSSTTAAQTVRSTIRRVREMKE